MSEWAPHQTMHQPTDVGAVVSAVGLCVGAGVGALVHMDPDSSFARKEEAPQEEAGSIVSEQLRSVTFIVPSYMPAT